MQQVLCKSCDQTVSLPDYRPGIKCVCPHCGALLRSGHLVPLKNTAAIALAALILLSITIFEPFLAIESLGIEQRMSLASIFSVLKGDWSLLLYIFLLFAFLLPTTMLLQTVLAGITGLRPDRRFCELYQFCHRFCMVDVFVLGVLVSLVKLTSLANVSFHEGFFTGFAFSVLLMRCWIKLPPEQMWDHYMQSKLPALMPGKSGMAQGMVRCHHCGQVHPFREGGCCPRCLHKSSLRVEGSREKSTAMLLAALILYLPSNLYPIMFTQYLGNSTGSNIVDGVIALWNMDSRFVALVILTASIFIPVFKILMLFYLIFMTASAKIKKPALLSRIYRVISFIGKWSMIDVFVVIIMSSVVRIQGLLTIDPGLAILAFCAVVLITMFAAEVFDERLIWDMRSHNGRATSRIKDGQQAAAGI